MDGADGRSAGARLGDGVDAATLDAARFALARAHPHRSAQRTFYFTQILAFVLIVAGACAGFATAISLGFSILHYAALALFATAILWRLLAAAHSKRLLSRLADPPAWPTYTVLCPVYREANVIPELIAAIDALKTSRDRKRK